MKVAQNPEQSRGQVIRPNEQVSSRLCCVANPILFNADTKRKSCSQRFLLFSLTSKEIDWVGVHRNSDFAKKRNLFIWSDRITAYPSLLGKKVFNFFYTFVFTVFFALKINVKF